MSRRSGADDRASSGASLAGSVFAGQWRVLRRLRAGGSLYAAEQVSTGRPCVLRVLDPALVADDRGRVGFEAACAQRAKIASDHVVDLLDAGIDRKSGAPWFALTFVDGESLAVRAARPMPFDDVHEALAQLAHGLDALGAAGVAGVSVTAADALVAKSRYSGSPFSVVIPDVWVGAWAASGPRKGSKREDAAERTAAVDMAAFALVAFQLLTAKEYGDDAASGQATPSERAEELGCERELPDGFDAWFARCHDASDRGFETASSAVDALAPGLDAASAREAPRDGAPAAPTAKKRPPSKLFARLRSGDYFIPAALALSLVAALGVRQFIRVRRARAARAAPAVVAARPTAPEPSNAAAAAPSPPPNAGPPRLDDATLRDLQTRLSSTTGSQPVWIAIAAGDPAAATIAERLQSAFEGAGWRTHTIQRSNLRARPGLFVFAADDSPPSYVQDAVRALGGAGITPTVASGYRAYYEERSRTSPDFRGIRFDADQTWVIAVGRGQ